MLRELLGDIDRHCSGNIRFVLTLNEPESLPFEPGNFRYPVSIVRNTSPKGFGANHNNAFRLISGDYFCVLNPDIRLHKDPFEKLLNCLHHTKAALAGPLVLHPNGSVEDSARRFPTPFRIARKIVSREQGLDYHIGSQPMSPDWIAGMFMLFPTAVFRDLGGFDERYFLYYEDVDICARLRLAGRNIVLCPNVQVMHAARRESHGNRQYLRWHIASILRFFCSAVFLRLASRGLLSSRRFSSQSQRQTGSSTRSRQ